MAASRADQDPFVLLGLQPSYALTREALRSALLRESLRWHPDRLVGGAPQQRAEAEERMAAVNSAHARLADPIGRAEALLERAGAPMPRGSDQVSCPGSLLALLELKEELAEARAGGQPERWAEATRRLAQEEERSLHDLARAFAAWEAAGAPRERARELHARLAEATYLRRTAEDTAPAGAAA